MDSRDKVRYEEIDSSKFKLIGADNKSSEFIARPVVTYWSDAWRRFRANKAAMVAFVILILLTVMVIIGPIISGYSFKEAVGEPNQFPSAKFWFGTDEIGRDLFTRLWKGGRISIFIGIVGALISTVIGSIYGAVSAYAGGKVDVVMMRIVDIIYTVPDVLIIILLAQTLKFPLEKLSMLPAFTWMQKLGSNMISMFIVFALLYWVGMARIVRSQIMILKQSEYVTAARALGAGPGRIIFKHLIVNCIGTLIVTTTLQIPSSIFTESFLSFLGLGVQAPMPSLGSLASAALNGFQTYPEKLFAPAFLIFIIILSFNLLGDGLRDAFDPKLKQQ